MIGILAASLIVSVSMGTYQNWDSTLEFEAATNTANLGFPYLSTGFMINQPPVGFYLDALVFKAFGLSYVNGVGFMTFFGLASVVLLYALGNLLYGKATGLAAAALFSLNPWHVFMSRMFLIDNQFLFFGLLCLIVGDIAVRKGSEKLILISGAIFAVALLTKLFSVFLLVPLVLFYFTQRQTGFKLTLKRVLLFLVPSLVLHAVWYGGFANQHFFGVYFPTDFIHPVLVTNPSSIFWLTLMTDSAGWLILVATSLSLVLSFSFRKHLAGFFKVDLVCAATIAVVLGLNSLLVFAFGLIVPYVSVFKYSYITLPFFCLLAASLIKKSALMVNFGNLGNIRLKAVLLATGLVLLAGTVIENALYLNQYLTHTLVAFDVDSSTYYPFNLFSPHIDGLYFQAVLSVALFLIALSLVPSMKPLFGKFRKNS